LNSILDSLFTIPWNPNYIAENINSFIWTILPGKPAGSRLRLSLLLCRKQEKSQAILNTIMSRFYGMGDLGMALSEWTTPERCLRGYVFNAIAYNPFRPQTPGTLCRYRYFRGLASS